jgi:hypothetical protein
MTGKAKTLVLAFLAIAAIGGVTASAASAGEIHIKDMGKITGDGTQIENTVFTTGEGELKCPQAKFNIHTVYKLNAEKKQEDVETTASTFTVTLEENTTPLEPETLHCTHSLGQAIVHMNGCDFDSRIDNLTTQVTCPTEKQITIIVKSFGVLKCTFHIPEQGELGALKAADNETHQDIKLTFEVKGIKYTSTPGEGLGKCTETQAGTDGQFTGKVTVQGTAAGVASNIWHESAPQSAGEIHIKDMGKVTGDGTQAETMVFSTGEGQLQCPQAKFNIHTAYKLNAGKQEDVETTATTFTVKVEENETPIDPETLHCKHSLGQTIVHMNGCDFNVHINTLQATVTCPPEKQITIIVKSFGINKCITHIPEQEELSALDTPVNNETKQDIQLTSTVKGIKYTMTKGEGFGSCTETPAGTDGQFTGKVTVQGTAAGVASNIWHE